MPPIDQDILNSISGSGLDVSAAPQVGEESLPLSAVSPPKVDMDIFRSMQASDQKQAGLDLLESLRSPDAKASAAALEAVKQSPAQAAENKSIATKTGLPLATVAADPARAKAKMKFDAIPIDEIMERHSTLGWWMSDPNNAAIVQEDVPAYMQTSEFLQGLDKHKQDVQTFLQDRDYRFGPINPSFTDQLAGSFQKGQHQTELAGLGQQWMNSILFGGEELSDEQYARVEFLEKELQRNLGPMGPVGGTFAVAAEQLPILGYILGGTGTGAAVGGGTGLAVGAVTGPGALATGAAGAVIGAKAGAALSAYNLESGLAFTEYVNLTDAQGNRLDPQVAATAALLVGSVNAGAEYFSLRLLGKTFGGAKHLIRSQVREALKDPSKVQILRNMMTRYGQFVAGETATETFQEFTNVVGAEMAKLADEGSFTEQTIGTAIDRIFSKETWERVGEAGQKGFQAAILLSAPGTVISAVGENNYNRRLSENEQARIDHINQVVTESGIKDKSPETLAEVAQEIEEAAGDAAPVIHMDAADVRETLQQAGVDPESVPGLENLEEKAALGQDVEVKASDFVSKIIGSEVYDQLRPHMRLSSESTSPHRQQLEQTERQAFIQNLVAEAERNAETYAESQQIYAEVTEQLIQTGRLTRGQAKTAAQLIPAWATVQSTLPENQGKSIRQIFQESGLSVEGPFTAEQERIQAGRPSAETAAILDQLDLSGLTENARSELEEIMSTFEEDNVGDLDAGFRDLIDRVDEQGTGAFSRSDIKSIREAAVAAGLYREISQEEIDATSTTGGKKFDFQLDGKKYVWAESEGAGTLDTADVENIVLEQEHVGSRGDNHKLTVERAKRRLAERTTLSAEEKAVIKEAAAGQKGVTQKAITERVRSIKAQFPPGDGWAPLTLSAVNFETKKAGTVINPVFAPVPYSFTKGNEDEMTDALVAVVEGLRSRAAAGDENAKVILRQQKWYSAMQERLREEFGSLGDLFADLLGATSPKTPVGTNWRFAVDALGNALQGKYDGIIDEVARWAERVDQQQLDLEAYVAAERAKGRTVTAIKRDAQYKVLDKAVPLKAEPRQSNGKRFGTNSRHVAKALGDMWRMIAVGSSPKARNLSGNLIGFTDEATIDLWAARLLQDLAGQPRVSPRAEQAVDGAHLVGSTLEAPRVGGNFGVGQRVFRAAGDRVGMKPSDLQAVVWFYQKEIWSKNNWTNVDGEGGSFEEQADKNPVDRFVGLLSMEQSLEFQGQDLPATPERMAPENAKLTEVAYAVDGIIAAKAGTTIGRYGADETSFDLEMIVKRGSSPQAVWAEMQRIGRENNQDSIGLARVLQPDEDVDVLKHRPGLEIYFNRPTAMESLAPVLEQLDKAGVSFFTFATDARRTADVREGEMGKVTGLRVMYVPEFMGKPDGFDQMTDEQLAEFMEEQAEELSVLRDAASDIDGVSYSEVLYYDTDVLFNEELQDADSTGTGAEASSASDRTSWRGRTVREGFEASDRQPGVSAGDGDQVGTGSVRDDATLRQSTIQRDGQSLAAGVRRDPATGIPVNDAGRVPLTHWGRREGLAQLDPDFWGTAAAGRERHRAAVPGWRNRTYFGLPGYTVESNVNTAAKARYFSDELLPTDLYNLDTDPDGIIAATREATADLSPVERETAIENAIVDAGYKGYWGEHPSGPIAAVFEQVNVSQAEKFLGAVQRPGTPLTMAGLDIEGNLPTPTMFEQESRGQFDPATATIRLMQASDLSTFLHEAAHFFLEFERNKPQSSFLPQVNAWFAENVQAIAAEANDVGREGADPVELYVTPDQVNAYLTDGTTGDARVDAAIRVATHEQFARGFELYLKEGKAPSTELRKAFRAFARWVVAAYQSIFGGADQALNVNLTPEMRETFDRMLATEEQIAIAENRAKYKDLFTDAVAAGMTEEQYQAYLERQREPTEKAKEDLRTKLLKEITRRATKDWQDELAARTNQATDELRGERVYVATERLQDPDGTVKMDRRAVKELLGIEKIPPKLRGMTVTGGAGLRPDDAAALLDYPAGEQMLREILDAPSLKDAAAAQAEKEMLDAHGDILNDGTLDRMADEAVKNEERGKRMLEEMKILARQTRRPAIEMQVIKGLAEEQIEKLPLSNIRPDRYHRAEVQAAQKAAVALAAGDRAGALMAKTQQAMNFYLWKAAIEAQKDGQKLVKYAAKFRKKKTLNKLARAGNQYLDQILGILARVELRASASIKGVTAERRSSIDKWAAERVDAGDNIQLSPDALDEQFRRHWKEIPVGQLRGIHESMRNIEYVANFANSITMEGERVDFQNIREKALEQLEQLKGNIYPKRDEKGTDPQADLRWKAATMSKTPWVARWLDNQKGAGLFQRLFDVPFIDAFDAKMAIWQEVGVPISNAINNLSKDAKKRILTKHHIPELGDDPILGGDKIISVALNTGNAGNLRKLLMGEGWALTEEEVSIDNPQLQAVLAKLGKEEWDLVQFIWDQIDLLRPMMQEVHKRTSGLDLAVVEATPVETPFGTYRGGYYPVKYDPRRDTKANISEEKKQQAAATMFDTNGMFRPSADTGATIARTDYYAPIDLGLDLVMNHIDEVAHYVTHYEPVIQTNKILEDPEIASALKKKIGYEEYNQLRDWLNAVAKDGRVRPPKHMWSPWLQRLRMGATLGMMGVKVSTGLMQLLGLSNAAAFLGKARLAKAITAVYTSWPRQADMWNVAEAKSKVLRHRMKTMDRELYDALKALEGKGTWAAKAQETSMKHIALIQTYMVDLPTWYAAYNKGLEEHADKTPEVQEARAVQYADWAVEQIHGSGTVKNLAHIQRATGEEGRMLTMFMTFFSAFWNQNRDVARGARQGNLSVTDVAAMLTFMWVVPVLAEMWMRGELEPDDEKDEDVLDVVERAALRTITYPAATIPVLRDAVNGVISGYEFNISPLNSIVAAGLKGGEGVWNGLIDEDKEISAYQLKSLTKLLGAWFKVPGVNQFWQTGEHLYEVMEEGEELTLRELAFGPKRD